MKNITTLIMVSIFLLTTTSVSANYEKGEMKRGGMENEKMGDHEALPGVDDETKEAIQELHESMQAELAELKESSTEDMDEDDKAELQEAMAEIRDAHHDEVIALLGDNTEAVAALEERKAAYEEKQAEMKAETEEKMAAKEELLATLDDDTRVDLEELQADYKEALAELKEDYSEDMSDEEREGAKAQMTELREAHTEAVAELLADYPEVLAAMSEKKEDMDGQEGKMNGNMRGENKDMDGENMKSERANKDYSEKGGEKRGMYKKQFATKYQARLETVSDDKLVKVLGKIDVYIEKYENNDEITEERKENILAQLAALAEMIQEIVDASAE